MRIAICDDQEQILKTIENTLKESVLSNREYEISVFTDEKDFISHIKDCRTDIAIIDIMLSAGKSGIEAAKEIKKIISAVPIIRHKRI